MAEFNEESVFKEGFLCSVCLKDLRSPNALLVHFQDLHAEEQDLLKSIKELVHKAKKKILQSDEQDLEFQKSVSKEKYFLEPTTFSQEPGQVRSHTDYFKKVRRDRLGHLTTETNKLIIRLDKLLHLDGSSRKQNEQELVEWLDGSTVTRCPSCASNFNIARRKHHCRLCGSIMCNSCSSFMSYARAKSIVMFVTSDKNDAEKSDAEDIRICDHCMRLLENRRRIQINQSVQDPITKLYEQLQKAKAELEPSIELYKKMYDSLLMGDTKYSLQDAQSLRASIAKRGEYLDAISKQILNIPEEEDNPVKHEVKVAIRQATNYYIREYLLNQPELPTPKEIEKIRKERSHKVTEVHQPLGIPKVRKIAVTTGWSPDNVTEDNIPETADDPLIQQMNIVRNYIQQARKAQRFEEVASLQENLKMLKETYLSQQNNTFESTSKVN